MITHLLDNKMNLNVREDISYKLIQIKHEQVDKN